MKVIIKFSVVVVSYFVVSGKIEVKEDSPNDFTTRGEFMPPSYLLH